MVDGRGSEKIGLDDLPIAEDRDAAWRMIRAHGRVVDLGGEFALTDANTVETAFVPRVTAEKTVLDGRTLPAGTRVFGYLAAANRDESRHPDPYAVNFHRGDNPHASFGIGVHGCLGSHLARMEMRLVYEEWHKRIPDYGVAPAQCRG
jgi:Cytochrome P450